MGSSFLKMGIPDRPLPLFERRQTVCFLIFLKTSNGEWQTMRASMGAMIVPGKIRSAPWTPLIRYRMLYLTQDRSKGEAVAKGSLRVISNRLRAYLIMMREKTQLIRLIKMEPKKAPQKPLT